MASKQKWALWKHNWIHMGKAARKKQIEWAPARKKQISISESFERSHKRRLTKDMQASLMNTLENKTRATVGDLVSDAGNYDTAVAAAASQSTAKKRTTARTPLRKVKSKAKKGKELWLSEV